MANLKFDYLESEPAVLDGWMKKANVGILTRWQRRFFRLQGRCIFYFKKEFGEPPCGKIPLCNVEVKELPGKKGKKGRKSEQQASPKSTQEQTTPNVSSRSTISTAQSAEVIHNVAQAPLYNPTMTLPHIAPMIMASGSVDQDRMPVLMPPLKKAA